MQPLKKAVTGVALNGTTVKENIKKLVQDFDHLIYLHLEELLKLPISNQILPLREKLIM